MSGPLDPSWAAGYLLLEQAMDAGLVTTVEEVEAFGATMRRGLVAHTRCSGPAPGIVAAVEADILGEPAPSRLWTP